MFIFFKKINVFFLRLLRRFFIYKVIRKQKRGFISRVIANNNRRNNISREELCNRRIFILMSFKIGFIGLVLCRLFYMQILKNSQYNLLSLKNCISIIILYPLRGSIIDSQGNAIAENRGCFKIFLMKKEYLNNKSALNVLFNILNLSDFEMDVVLKKIQNAGKKDEITISISDDWDKIVKIEENRNSIPYIKIERIYLRNYKFKEMCSSITGYVREISKNEKVDLGISNSFNFIVGKSGLEKYYEDFLSGNYGHKQIEINVHGEHIKELSKKDPQNGKDLHVTIDSRLQKYIYDSCKIDGCVVVMDVKNGDIKSLCSFPSFDANIFNENISAADWNLMNQNNFLINKVVQGQYPVGSIFKIITIIAAIESGVNINSEFSCSEKGFLGEHFHCWKKYGHGVVTSMDQAIGYSCNNYMYSLAKKIGHNAIIETAKKFGFNQFTRIDMPFEVKGFVPDEEFKLSRFKDKWKLSDTLNLCIGQGFLLATPMQILRFITAIANGGYLITPHLNSNKAPNMSKIDVSETSIKIAQLGLYNVVNKFGGTAYASRIINSNMTLCGKTSTAQVVSKNGRDLSSKNIKKTLRNHGIFCGYAPYNDPKYAIIVLAEHGGSGSSVAVMARDILKYYLSDDITSTL